MDDRDLLTLPPDLPVPEDDGAADALLGVEGLLYSIFPPDRAAADALARRRAHP